LTGFEEIDNMLKDRYHPICFENVLNDEMCNVHPKRKSGESFIETCTRLMNERMRGQYND